MKAFHLKRGDEVTVISGAHKGKSGRILSVNSTSARAVVEGVAMHKKHLKKSDTHPSGAIVEREGSIHITNLMSKNLFEERLARRRQTSQVAR